MAREGIDSFLLDCHTNENISEIEATFGVKGFAVIVRLWQKIYSEKGYYCEWTERSPVLFLATWFGGNSGVDLNLINEVVRTALGNGLFDKRIYEKHSILTSNGIQKRYFSVIQRRRDVEVIGEYLLVSVANSWKIVSKNPKNVSKNLKNVSNGATSKVKESKEKESNKPHSTPAARGGTAIQMINEQGFSPGLEEAVKDWTKYKIEKRQAYKETGFRSLLSQIRKNAEVYGEDAVANLIRTSMSNNWQGIIWDKIQPQPESSTQTRKRHQESSFNSFRQRDYDVDELALAIMQS